MDTELNPVGDKQLLLSALQGHILGQARLVGTCRR
jgi:hypothetical protein